MQRRENKQSNSPVKDTILAWLEKLQTHHVKVLEQDQIDIFVDRLEHYTAYQVATALERCLDECDFMPKMPEVLQRIPEQRYPSENLGRFVLNGPPSLELIRPIMDEIDPNNAQLDPMKDREEIYNLAAAATRERFKRMGIDPNTWRKAKASA